MNSPTKLNDFGQLLVEENKKVKGEVIKYWVRKYARKFGRCEKCGYHYNLTLSHKDNNELNNDFANLEILCSYKTIYIGIGHLILPGCHTKHELITKRSPEFEVIWRGVQREIIRGTERPLGFFEKMFIRLLKRGYKDGETKESREQHAQN